eukprot:6254707-Prymnesium_polylepis.1
MDFLCMCSESELCRFQSPLQGGGMYISGSSTVTVTACIISGNSAGVVVSRVPSLLNRYVTVHRPVELPFFIADNRVLCSGRGCALRGHSNL